jgi:hypothetical protein
MENEDFLQKERDAFVSPLVKHEFETLVAFLDRFEHEVVGRTAEQEPAAEMQERLERFAEGECSENEREELCATIRDNPELVRWLAERVKRKRESSRNTSA